MTQSSDSVSRDKLLAFGTDSSWGKHRKRASGESAPLANNVSRHVSGFSWRIKKWTVAPSSGAHSPSNRMAPREGEPAEIENVREGYEMPDQYKLYVPCLRS